MLITGVRLLSKQIRVGEKFPARCAIRPFTNGQQRQQSDNEQELLHEGKHDFVIRAMFSSGCVNLLVWSQYVGNYFMNHNVVLHGIEMGGDVAWGSIGLFGTGLIFYFTREYAIHAVRRCYLTADNKRLGFQVHTILGYSGRKYEVPIGNAKFLPARSVFMSSVLPVSIKGFNKNLLIDPLGTFYHDEKLKKLLSSSEEFSMHSKEDRITTIKESFRRKNRKSEIKLS
eukprot:gene765-1460_t